MAEQGRSSARDSVQSIEDTGQVLERLAEVISGTADMARRITVNANEQFVGLEGVVQAMASLSESSAHSVDSIQQVDLNTARLKQQGVTDYFRVATGEQKDAISLGVFSRSDLAQRRLRAMRKQGFQPQLETVPLPRRVYWLDWPVEGNPALNAGDLGVLQDQYAGIDQWEQACAQP